VPAGAKLVRADRYNRGALATVAASSWDAVLDVATQPGHVRRAVRDLSGVAGLYLFVSTCGVYASLAEAGVDEAAPVVEPLSCDVMPSLDQYGSAKVACELAVRQGFGPARSLIVRPGLIGGPGDPTGRTTYWPARFAWPVGGGKQVLVPDEPDLPTSVIDVRDLAAWIVRLLQAAAEADGAADGSAATGQGRVYNAVGDSVPLGRHLELARSAAQSDAEMVRASSAWLIEHGVSPWSGLRSLPLWLTDDRLRGLGCLSNAQARAAGLVLRPLAQTLADSLRQIRPGGSPFVGRRAAPAGLSDMYELPLLIELAQTA
jgi:nucleoside-diphosphate-sugar epimerase